MSFVIMAVVSPPPTWLRRLRPADRVALCALVALALLGPSLVRLAGRELEPRLTTVVAWLEAGGGWPVREGPAPAELADVRDPWGRPFRWEEGSLTAQTTGGECVVRVQHYPVSLGPDVADPSDDIVVDTHVPSSAPQWKLIAVELPAAAALALVAWLAPAWWTLRRRRRRRRLVETACVLGAAAPALGLGWALARTAVGHRLAGDLPQLVPGPWAVQLTVVGLALVAALAVRLLSRPPETA